MVLMAALLINSIVCYFYSYSTENSLVYYIALKKAGVPTEYHIYAEGGHAFGLNESAQKIPDWEKLPISDWENLVERRLKTIKMISE
jgi:acetyl esterase/lipase